LGIAEELEKLTQLHERGVLSDQEYAEAKQATLQRPTKDTTTEKQDAGPVSSDPDAWRSRESIRKLPDRHGRDQPGHFPGLAVHGRLASVQPVRLLDLVELQSVCG